MTSLLVNAAGSGGSSSSRTYALTGEQSNKPSTARPRVAGLHQFNIFMDSMGMKIQLGPRDVEGDKKYAEDLELQKIFCSKEFWMQWGTFVADYATKQNSDEPLSPSSAYNYIGMAKERVRLIYPDHPIWIGHEWNRGDTSGDGWFTKIRDTVKNMLKDKRQKSGQM